MGESYARFRQLDCRTNKGFDSSGIRRMFDLAAKLKEPINLSIGQPDFDVPAAVKKELIRAVETEKTVTPRRRECRCCVKNSRRKLISSLATMIASCLSAPVPVAVSSLQCWR